MSEENKNAKTLKTIEAEGFVFGGDIAVGFAWYKKDNECNIVNKETEEVVSSYPAVSPPLSEEECKTWFGFIP